MGTGAEVIAPELVGDFLFAEFAAAEVGGAALGAELAGGAFDMGGWAGTGLEAGYNALPAAEAAAGFWGSAPKVAGYAADLGLSTADYMAAVDSMGGEAINTAAGYDLSPATDAALGDYGSVNEFGTTGIDPNPMAQENVFNPTQSLDSAPQTGMDGLDAGSYGYGPAETTGSPFGKLKDVLKSPQYQLAKTGIDLYSMASDNQANQAGLRRFNELADRGKWANDTAQGLYNNPNAFFNSPAFKQSQAGTMDAYKRKQAASGRRSDQFGLALAMQKDGMNQFNNYSQGLSRYNTQPSTSGLQGMYQGAGKGRSNMLNTLANKDLWEAVG